MANAIRSWLLPLITIVILLLLVAVMAGYFRTRIEPGIADASPADVGDAVAVLARTVPFQEAVPASVEARETTIISSRILARITAIGVRAGDYVEQGELLLELESGDLLARAEGARERIRSVEARLQEARQNLERVEQLFERGLISVADRDAVRADEASLAAELESARNVLEEAQAAVGYGQIRSPIAGRVVDRFAEPGDTASPGAKLLSLYNPFSLRVEARVREQLALALREGLELTVEIPSLQRTLTATIEELVPAADPGSRSFMVKALLPSEKGLLPGMYARLLVPAGEREQLVIPADRVASVGQLDVVWVASDNGVLRRFVRLGRSTEDDLVEILSGLEPGELVLPVPGQRE
ncbi:MAG: efflux RND transporter periplasmic adaptor subunit [Halioglobus sp.]|nr:efflux RND transporter periplasmic adaptor subunit [Halioglobus sp.]